MRSTYYPGVRANPGTYYPGVRANPGTYYPGVCTKPGTYYQGWFIYMRYTQGQNEEYLLSRSAC